MNKRFLFFLLFFGIGALTFFAFFKPVVAMNQDLGRHLKVGEIIVKTRKVPKTNLFSYTHPDFPFVNSHWLSGVIFYLVEKTIGMQGFLFPFNALANYGYSIQENQHLFFLWEYSHSPQILVFAIVSFLLFSILVSGRKNLTIIDWFLCIVFTVLSISAIRHFPLFVITTWIPFPTALSTSFPHLEHRIYAKQAFFTHFFLLFPIFSYS